MVNPEKPPTNGPDSESSEKQEDESILDPASHEKKQKETKESDLEEAELTNGTEKPGQQLSSPWSQLSDEAKDVIKDRMTQKQKNEAQQESHSEQGDE
jgi:hypothetical protein